MNEYYVYEWIRLDTNEPFYVGKGKDDRCYKLTRGNNNHFNNIVKSIPVVVNILHDNLDEETAFGLEVWYIREYRDIVGYDLTNINDGGEGCALVGKNSPWYGKHHSEETKKKISKNHADMKGKNSPWYGKHHSEESKRKSSQSHKKENLSKETIEKMRSAKLGKKNNNAKKIICITTKQVFYTTRDGAKFYDIDNSSIVKCCKGKLKSAGKLSDGTKLVWRYLVWEHGKKFRIKK